jgi:hypothetical protein
METGRELFLKYDYVEAKDLCKQFITVVSGVLAGSVNPEIQLSGALIPLR